MDWTTEEAKRQWREFELPRLLDEIERYRDGDRFHPRDTHNSADMSILRQGVPK